MKTAMELAFRKLMATERSKKEIKWPEGDLRRAITVSLWEAMEARKALYAKKLEEEAQNG